MTIVARSAPPRPITLEINRELGLSFRRCRQRANLLNWGDSATSATGDNTADENQQISVFKKHGRTSTDKEIMRIARNYPHATVEE